MNTRPSFSFENYLWHLIVYMGWLLPRYVLLYHRSVSEFLASLLEVGLVGLGVPGLMEYLLLPKSETKRTKYVIANGFPDMFTRLLSVMTDLEEQSEETAQIRFFHQMSLPRRFSKPRAFSLCSIRFDWPDRPCTVRRFLSMKSPEDDPLFLISRSFY